MAWFRSPFLGKALLAALFLWVQGAALYDAAAHGDAPHQHYGVACDLGHAVAPQAVPVPTTPALPRPPLAFTVTQQPSLDFRRWSRPPGRAPPPRSPPSLNR